MQRIDSYDVIVVGGGPGGVGAAVKAGRSGAKTLLLEREGCLGGGATTMLVHPFMPHWTKKGPNGEPPRIVNAGLFREITDRLIARNAGQDGHVVRFDDEILRIVLDELVAEAGVDVIFHAALFDATVDGDRVVAARFAHNGGPIEVTGKVFIDATGDGLLAEAAGCEIEVGDDQGHVMPMTLNFILGGVDTDNLPGNLKALAKEGDKDTPALINTNLSCTSIPRKGWMHFNAVRIPGGTIDTRDLSTAEAEGRRRVENYLQWLRAKVPAFKDAYLVKTGQHMGIRESRRVVGDYYLDREDFGSAAKFDDGIACCSYPVDIHGQQQGITTFAHLPEGDYYQIPYRCLTPRGRSNLLVAARSISASSFVHASLRIMPVVINIGEAAGYAAAMCLPGGDVRAVDLPTLRRQIAADGGALEALDPETAKA